MLFKPAPGWKIYKDQMSQLDHGDPLWQPAPLNYFKRVQLGDVGYVRKGCFHLLFSAGEPLAKRRLGVDVPLTFQPLDVGPIVNPQPRLPGCLSTNTVRETGANLAASTSSGQMLEPGFSISFELSEKQGAALVTKYSTYSEDIRKERVFEEYTRRHYDSWVAFARESGYGNDIKPVLVTGVDMTRDFAMMACLNNGVQVKSEFTAAVSGVVSASASAWGTWRTEGLVHTNCGPQMCLPPSPMQTTDVASSSVNRTESVSEDYNQCVFVRYYTMRKRPLMIPRFIRAAAGPHDLGPGDRDNEEPPLEDEYDSDNTSLLFDDDGGDDRSSFTSVDSDSDEADVIFHNTTGDESDDFDVIADYIFRNSDAESVLVHHKDITLLRETGGSKNTLAQLFEKQPHIIVDRDGVGRIQHSVDPSTKIRSSGLVDVTPPGASSLSTGAGTSNDKPLPDANRGSGSSIPADFYIPSWERLMNEGDRHVFSVDEPVETVKVAITSQAFAYTCFAVGKLDASFLYSPALVSPLCIHGAQTFIDAPDKALDIPDVSQTLRRRCLKGLCHLYAHHALVSNPFTPHNRSDDPPYRGGFADVWEGIHKGNTTATKASRIYRKTDEFTQRSKLPPPPPRVCFGRDELIEGIVGLVENFEPVALIGVGGIGKTSIAFNMLHHDWIKSGFGDNRRFIRCDQLLASHAHLGTIAVDERDLKGFNILVDRDRRACLADFGLSTIVPDSTIFTTRWLAPELFHPQLSYLYRSGPTKKSDCYSLEMVIYEALTGQPPWNDSNVMREVTNRGRPGRQKEIEEVWFTCDLWKILDLCWEAHAQSRPSIEALREWLEQMSGARKPLPVQADEGVDEEENQCDLVVYSTSQPSPPFRRWKRELLSRSEGA